MHPSSLANMRKARHHLIGLTENSIILDVGGRGLETDRSYRSVFPEIGTYWVADIEHGLGVTHLMPSPYTLPFEDDSIDVVVSGQTLEHVDNPFRLVSEMRRVLKPGHRMILIAPSAGPRHDRRDCWRFQDNAFDAIARECGLHTIADWIDTSAPDERSAQWRDHIFIGQKPGP